MRDSFSYAEYRALIEALTRTHIPVRFVDLRDGVPPNPFVILRHDVDYSPRAALRMAALESAAGWHSTYFLLPNGPYYNLLDPHHAALPRHLVELGHEVGLHYDVRFLDAFPRRDWDELLDAQARLVLEDGRAALSGRGGADRAAVREDLERLRGRLDVGADLVRRPGARTPSALPASRQLVGQRSEPGRDLRCRPTRSG